ncbi:MAG TPA: putative metal-binding motif-containing protein [bacterium]|nr:putative metal-binding motif-containing protein [bacterium]
MRRFLLDLLRCGFSLLLLTVLACSSSKPQSSKDEDTTGDGDSLLADRDALTDEILPTDEETDVTPDTEGSAPDGDTTVGDDAVPVDDGADIFDDDELFVDEATDIDEPIVDEEQEEDDPDEEYPDEAVVEDEFVADDAWVLPDIDSPVGCNDQITCTEDLIIGGQCKHLPRHEWCEPGLLCNKTDGCVEPDEWVCRSCESAPCPYDGDICAPLLGEKLCLLPCDTDAECPGDFRCNDLFDLQGLLLGRGCAPTNFVCCLDIDGDNAGVGAKCALYDCDESSAQRYPGAIEQCNGADDDCDLIVDNNLGTAPLCAKQGGICQGLRKTCGGTAGWLACTTAQYLAWNDLYQETEALCDGVDNDCNGVTDDPFATELFEICTDGIGECKRAGFMVCNDTHDGVVCNAVKADPASEELCNNKDDDCDTFIDNDSRFEQKGEVCFVGTGACLRAGIKICNGDGDGLDCSVTQGTPTDEECNGIDDDCVLGIDNGVEASAPQCALTAGVCSTARKKCGGTASWLDCGYGDYLAASGGTYEVSETLCDGLDNDCIGGVDNNLTNYAPACDNPVGPAQPLRGVCVGARKACGGASSWLACGAAQFGADYQATENRCDYLDNDCDGELDEGFLNAGTGKYDQNTACGNCATNCTTIYAKPNAEGWCDATGTPECKMRCTNTSLYFDLNGVPDDGCEFTLDVDAIYVSESNGDDLDPNCGLGPVAIGQKPCATIAKGLQRAGAPLNRSKIFVADGTYEETVILTPGKSLYGGYRPDTWGRHAPTTMTIIRGNTFDYEPHKATIIASAITATTVLDGFVLYGQSATGTGGNSYVIYVTGSNASLTISNNVIYGAMGGPGASMGQANAGAPGEDGGGRPADGAGYDPVSANGRDSGCTITRQSNNGGSSSCGVAGGRGGGNYCAPSYNNYGSSRVGDNGSGSGAGVGGGRGYDGRVHTVTYNPPYNMDCTIPSGSMNGTNGTNGGSGTDGSGGTGCSSTNGSVVSGHWGGAGGNAGGVGTAGGGGGGGGSGGGGDSDISGENDVFGSHGGGGGAGGCGGTGASGGAAGGGSFAIFVTGSTGAVVLRDNAITLGSGGRGGNGGTGGSGGEGGIGGAGGNTLNTPPLNCGGVGGAGGNGGNGGAGGGGGGGCGGTAVGIGYSGTAPNFATGNTYYGNTPDKGGAGGAGGSSMGLPGSAGSIGAVYTTRGY